VVADWRDVPNLLSSVPQVAAPCVAVWMWASLPHNEAYAGVRHCVGGTVFKVCFIQHPEAKPPDCHAMGDAGDNPA
jgi:hypothetical protein